jgi:hypothetical protein
MSAEKSLHSLVEKWLAPMSWASIRVIRFSRIRPEGSRYVCVEARRSHGSIALWFFRHKDGTWRVFPPDVKRLNVDMYVSAK